ncbi:hemagglutinin repeat-containing protein [Helicobacter sp. 13S00477-4]|uniref:hemagglutinin repeat-containing protein n=1 Tax=Helicobacter sp. 13S00477-4 TaxID=1905759 RepID=UPI000BC80C2C|nr:hemagglutinin repeat-containing protein [Helicobacter sp. 13S00477-4]PAF52263.1 hypothetical protein BKH44_02845 [Helicobacter sp. 13S00477-4]
MNLCNLFKKILSLLISIALIVIQPTFAIDNTPDIPNIIIDTSKVIDNNPTLTKAPNGVDIINIASPNQGGISNNYYETLNVDNKGLIFNNSKDLSTDTRLSGWITGNPHLKDKEAKLILNQITSNKDSSLLGFIETAGGVADLIIANPNGITCKGCGFIHNNSVSLITANFNPEENNKFDDLNNLQKTLNLMVQKGHINIEALNASNIPTLNLLSQSITINGKLNANTLNMILGQNKINLDFNHNAPILLYEPISIQTADNQDKTYLALDVSYLGSVLANSIYLVATQEGIGIKDSGIIATTPSTKAGDGGFSIDVNGRVEIAYPKEGIRSIDFIDRTPAEDSSFGNEGLDTDNPNPIPMLYATSSLNIKSKSLQNHSLIFAKGDLKIVSDVIDNIGVLELENQIISKESHYGWCEDNRADSACGTAKKHSIFDYTTTITEDKLKQETYSPALILSENNIHIKALKLNNDSSLIKAKGDNILEVKDITNNTPVAKRMVKKDGTRKDYDRYGYCVIGIPSFLGGSEQDWNCESRTRTYPFHPAPAISSIEIDYPKIDLSALMVFYQKDFLDSKLDSFTELQSIIESNPIYTDKSQFLKSDIFTAYLKNRLRENPSIALDALSAQSTPSDPIANLSSQRALLDNFNQNQKENILTNLASEHIQKDFKTLENISSTHTGIFGNDIFIIGDSLKNTSFIASTSDMTIHTPYVLNQNGSIIAKNDVSIYADGFKHISSKLKGSDVNIIAKDIIIESGVNQKDFSLKEAQSIFPYNLSSHHQNAYPFGVEKIIYSSSIASLDSLSSISSDNLSINSQDVYIKGASLQAKDKLNIKASNASINTLALYQNYSDDDQTHQNQEQLQSSLKANNISIDTNNDLKMTSIDLKGNESIAIASGGSILIDTAQNTSFIKNILTSYSHKILESTKTDTTNIDSSTTHIANTLAGKNISMSSKGDLKAYNLSVKSDEKLALSSDNNLTLSNLADSTSHTQDIHSKTTGIDFSSKGDKYTLSYGTDTSDSKDFNAASIHHNQSIQANNIYLTSGNQISIQSSDLKAQGDIKIAAQDISIISLEDEHKQDYTKTTTSDRFGISVSKADVGEILGNLGKKAIASTGKTLSKLYDNPKDILHKTGNWLQEQSNKIKAPSSLKDTDLNVSVGFTHSKTHQSKSQTQTIASASNLKANNIALSTRGDINIIGSDLSTNSNINLTANNLNITAAKNTNIQDKTSSEDIIAGSISANLGKNTGFGGEFSYDHNHSSAHLKASSHTASSLAGKNISVHTTEHTTITGSNLNASDNTLIQTTHFKMTASKDEASFQSQSQSYGGKIKGSYNGINTSLGLSGHYSDSRHTINTIHHNASSLNTQNLTLQAKKDTLIASSDMNVSDSASISADSLSVYALQDTHQDKANAKDFAGSIDGSIGVHTQANANLTIGISDISKQSTTHQNASINANKLNININEDVNLIGGDISTSSLDNQIKGKTHIQDIQDKSTSKNYSVVGTMSLSTSAKPTALFTPTYQESISTHTQSSGIFITQEKHSPTQPKTTDKNLDDIDNITNPAQDTINSLLNTHQKSTLFIQDTHNLINFIKNNQNSPIKQILKNIASGVYEESKPLLNSMLNIPLDTTSSIIKNTIDKKPNPSLKQTLNNMGEQASQNAVDFGQKRIWGRYW